MAVAYDASADAQATGGTTTVTITSFACSGSERVIFCGMGNSGASPGSLTSIVRGGSETFTLPAGADTGTFSSFFHAGAGYYVAPATAAANIVVTISNSDDELYACAISMTTVDQTTPIGTATNATGNSNSPSVTTTATANDMVCDTEYAQSVGAITSGQTKRQEDTSINSSTCGAGSTAQASNPTMSYTNFQSGPWGIVAIPFLVSSGGGGGAPKTLSLLGVGA